MAECVACERAKVPGDLATVAVIAACLYQTSDGMLHRLYDRLCVKHRRIVDSAVRECKSRDAAGAFWDRAFVNVPPTNDDGKKRKGGK